MNPLHLAALAAMNLLWALTYPSFKLLAPYFSPGQVVTVRFALAAAGVGFLWPFLGGKAPRGRDLRSAILMGVIVFALGPRLQVAGVQRGRAGDASLLVALEPLVTTVAAAWFLQEKIPPSRWTGFAVGMIGIVVISQVWDAGFHPLSGMAANLLFVSSFVCESAYSIMGKPLFQRSGLAKILGVSLLAGTAVNLIWDGAGSLQALPAVPPRIWLLLLYLAWICTFAGYLLWYVVIREAEVSLMALTIFIQPVAGLALSILLLGESPHWGQLWGSLIIAGGLFIGLRRVKAPPAESPSRSR